MNSIISEKNSLYNRLRAFPPFYTLQDHEQSRRKQIGYWAEMIHTCCREQNIVNTSVDQIHGLPLMQDDSSGIPKRLSRADLVEVLRELARMGCLEFQLNSQKLLISLFSPYEIADDLYRWAKENYLIGNVQTFNFITEGDRTTPREKFYRMPKELFLKVMDVMEKQNKAARIVFDDELSVKFV